MDRKRNKESRRNRIHRAMKLKDRYKKFYIIHCYNRMSECNVMLHIIEGELK